MITTRSLLRFAYPAFAAALLASASPWLAQAADVCVEIFHPPKGTKSVCFDCNSVALTAEQERLCNTKCSEPEFRDQRMCYRRREDTAPVSGPAPAPVRASSDGNRRSTTVEIEEER